MKTTLTLFFSLIIVTAFSQDTTYFDAEGMEVTSLTECHYYELVENVDTNIVRERSFFKNGQEKSERNYSNYSKFILDGKSKVWYENGQIRNDIDYKAGKYHGKLLTYWENGKSKREDTYNEGKLIDGKCWDSNGDKIPHFAYEQMPEFPGGENELVRYLSSNIIYPIEARKNGQTGTVFVTFVIDINGSVINARVLRGVSKLLNDEAVRVVNAMPKWKPGKQDGEPVKVSYNLPIRFSLK